jgi:hypothetical protein
VTGDGRAKNDKFSLTMAAPIANGGRITLKAKPAFSPSECRRDHTTSRDAHVFFLKRTFGNTFSVVSSVFTRPPLVRRSNPGYPCTAIFFFPLFFRRVTHSSLLPSLALSFFSPLAPTDCSADKNGVETNMTNFGDMHNVANLDNFDLTVRLFPPNSNPLLPREGSKTSASFQFLGMNKDVFLVFD